MLLTFPTWRGARPDRLGYFRYRSNELAATAEKMNVTEREGSRRIAKRLAREPVTVLAGYKVPA